MISVQSVLRQVPDPREKQGLKHPLHALLGLMLLSMLSDHKGRLSLQAVCVHVMFFVKSEGWIDMDHKQFQEWLSGIDHLSPAQRQQTKAVFLRDTETSASLAAIEAAVGGRSPVPALWHARRHIAWQGKGSATVPVQRMQEDIQCRDRHPLVGSAPQGQVAFLRSLSC